MLLTQTESYYFIKNIIDNNLPRKLYNRIPLRVGKYCYITLLNHERILARKRLINQAEVDKLPTHAKILYLGLVSGVDDDNVVCFNGYISPYKEIRKELGRCIMGKSFNQLMYILESLGYIQQVKTTSYVGYKLTDKGILPRNRDLEFEVY